MAVRARTAGRAFGADYDGVTFWFCCAGCRRNLLRTRPSSLGEAGFWRMLFLAGPYAIDGIG